MRRVCDKHDRTTMKCLFDELTHNDKKIYIIYTHLFPSVESFPRVDPKGKTFICAPPPHPPFFLFLPRTGGGDIFVGWTPKAKPLSLALFFSDRGRRNKSKINCSSRDVCLPEPVIWTRDKAFTKLSRVREDQCF